MSKTKKDNITDIKTFVEESYTIKPKELFMKELKWKYLVRSALRGKNIMIVGPTGSGKTFAVYSLIDALSQTVEEEVTEERLNELKASEDITIIKTEEIK